jgi:major coat protein
MPLRAMVDMEYDDEDQNDMVFPALGEKPTYPYGLRISLTEKELAKLGSDGSECFVGGILHIHALGRITSVSSTDGEMGKNCRIEVQLEDLAIESEDEENKAEEGR